MVLSVHVASVGTAPGARQYFFRQNKGSYTGIAGKTGVDEAGENDQDEPLYPVKELLAKGVLIRLAVSIKDGTKRKSRELLVTSDKVVTALEGLKGQPFAGGTITSARIPRDATFYQNKLIAENPRVLTGG